MKRCYIVRERKYKKFTSYIVYEREYRPEIWKRIRKVRYHEYYVGSYRDYQLCHLQDNDIKEAITNYRERHSK